MTDTIALPIRPRRGRPPALAAGLAEARVLDAATALFLEQGFGRTTLEQVAQAAQTGKSSLYGRYPDKQALFAAVVQRSIQSMFDELPPAQETGGLRERLRRVGRALAESLLVPRCVALMRITAAEALNFPDLAAMAYRVSLGGSVARVTAILEASGVAAPEAQSLALRFVEVALQPLSFQAVFGVPVDTLRMRCAESVEDALAVLVLRGLPSD